MAKGKPKDAAPKKPGKKMFTLSAWIALALLVPVAYLAVSKYRDWASVRKERNELLADVAQLRARNAVLGPVHEILQNRRFQVCNKSPDPLVISWLAAAYSDGKELKVFDSSTCGDWQPQEVAAGENKGIFLSSSQEGCNWSGPVIYYAMRFTKEAPEASIPYSIVARYYGYDRDCFTMQ